MRKTKIICTIGPASESEEKLRELMLAGMNVARFNFPMEAIRNSWLIQQSTESTKRTGIAGSNSVGYQRTGDSSA
mgnify:CR=1 FL=1